MYLSKELQEELRRLKKIDTNEVVISEGDIFVAVNVITQQRRIVNIDSSMMEAIDKKSKTNKQLLKG